jgi:hypothetical protein
MVFSIGFSIAAIGEQPDNLEAIRRTAADQDCRRHVHGHLGMSGNRKDPAPFATPGAIHQGVGHASMAEEISFVGRSMEHEGIIGKPHNRELLCVHH